MGTQAVEGDRRKSKRHKIKDVAFAVLTSGLDEELGQIVNISRGGLAFEYFVGSRRIRDAKYLDIMLTKNEMHIREIRVLTICDFEIENKLPFSTIAKRRQSVCFESLTTEQERQVRHLIQKHTHPSE